MVITQQGNLSDRYTLVPRTLIFLTNQDRVLLLKGSTHKRLWANLYNGIGGHIERGEDALRAAQRELHEETGLKDVQLWLAGVLLIDTGSNPGIGVFIFRGEAEAEVISSSPEGVPEWHPMADIAVLPLVEDLPILLPRVLAHQPGQPPLHISYHQGTDGTLQISFSP